MKLIKSFLSIGIIGAALAAQLTFQNNNSQVLNSKTNSVSGQQYDIHTFTWGVVVVTAINATNCFIQVSGDSFKIYANGSIHLIVDGNSTYTLKYITFDDKDPLPIAANEYQEDIDDTNIVTQASLTMEGGSITTVSGEIHIVTLFNNQIHIFSNDGVEETTWLSKVPAIGDDKVYRVFFTRGDFLFSWAENLELSTIQLFQADAQYNKGTLIGNIVNGSTKQILPTGVFESHYILELTNSVGDVEDCPVCAQNLNLGTISNPFRNFWYSFNGDQYPINDQDGAKLWCKVRAYNPLKYTDAYLTELDDITINKLILLSTNWPVPVINPQKITLVGGDSEITTASGYASIAQKQYYVAVEPIGADISVKYTITYANTTNIAPDFFYVNAGGYFCIKANTWQTYPDGQDFDVIASSTKNSTVSENKLTIHVVITGEPTPKITDITVSNTPKNITVKPNQPYLSPTPISAVVASTGGDVPQDVSYSLIGVKVPDCITINQEGYISIVENSLDKFQIDIKVKCISKYNDAYSGSSDIFTIYINKQGVIPGKNYATLAIAGSIVGIFLLMIGGSFWWWDYLSMRKKNKALANYNKRYNSISKNNDTEKETKQDLKTNPKTSKNITVKPNKWKTFWRNIFMDKATREKIDSKKGEK